MDGGAKRLGEMLLGEVEVEGLSSLLSSMRELRSSAKPGNHFGIPALDALLPAPAPRAPPPAAKQDAHQNSDIWIPDSDQIPQPIMVSVPSPAKKHSGGPFVELISLPPSHHPSGAGKTSLIYLIIAFAILPSTLSTAPIGGKAATVVLIDPLSHFNIPRLVEICVSIIRSAFVAAGKYVKPSHEETGSGGNHASSKDQIQACIKHSLQHLHILRPQSWSSLLGTLSSLPSYLFDSSKHHSMYRTVHSMILEDVDSFYWLIRADTDLGLASTITMKNVHEQSAQLTALLIELSNSLSATVILTSRSLVLNQPFRPPIPTSWPKDTVTTRLAVRRVEVNKFGPAISVQETEMERSQRWEVVDRGRFECWKIRGSAGQGDGDMAGFVFRVGKGVEIEEKDEEWGYEVILRPIEAVTGLGIGPSSCKLGADCPLIPH
ncbi:hypothetical protein BCR34DRAFT_540030 [Clohesyomyces aquaticus]|uniref:DNA recombination and repair protein Rad51-like C-terminal domain-containing protein n=1 Tax=Clohesyomyces aquaticus TaxID=1231657 RepID=A0A1Y1ZII9_9PLEO|nr:hypothetical protein BCR34DRAFT_540030 [Clohesyomyces aquaticus]